MSSLDNTTNNPSTNQTNNIIIFECSDVRRGDTGLILLKRTKNSNNDNDENKFELHLHNDYTGQAIAMILDIKDLVKMFESLEEYFLNV
jgi:hypothetical protein